MGPAGESFGRVFRPDAIFRKKSFTHGLVKYIVTLTSLSLSPMANVAYDRLRTGRES
jgi:hypothetical protein